jgi:cell division protein FtsZ
MVMPGLINLDFADVRSVMGEMGKAMMGTGEADGDGRALQAAEKAIANPLLDGVSMRGAKGVIVSIVGGEDMRLMEVDEAANHIRELVDPDANIIWGSAFNEHLNGKIRVSVVATGIDIESSSSQPASQPFRLGEVSTGGARPATVTAPASLAQSDRAAEPRVTGTLDLGAEDAGVQAVPPLVVPAPEPAAAPAYDPARFAARFDDVAGEDELVLDNAVTPEPPLVVEPPEPVAEQARAGGGTLFERMSQLARGQTRHEEEEEEADRGRGGFEVPRFLNRQNNQ